MGNANNILARVFTQKTLLSIINTQKLPDICYNVIRRYNISEGDNRIYEDILSDIYYVIKNNYKYEYYYKNMILNKMLLNVHRVHTTTALTEVPIANSIADLIMINGKGVVYEIKTDLDNLDRIENQINDYYKVFDHVCIVAGESKKNEVEKRFETSPVGIYILTRKNTLSKIKEPILFDEKQDVNQMFKVLRKKEYESIIYQLNSQLPQVPEVKYYQACKKIVCANPKERIYPLVLHELKKRTRIENMEITSFPESLHFLLYFSKLKERDLTKIRVFLKQPYMEVK